MSFPLVSLQSVSKSYEGGLIHPLVDVSFDITAGEKLAIMGASGSGKSTLLNIIGTLDTPTAGKILYNGQSRKELGPLAAFRAKHIGFVFQFHHLMPTLTLLENVELPLIPQKLSAKDRRLRSLTILGELGLENRAHFLPAKASGGERQRAAVARALVGNPSVILADEPTGQLDSKTGAKTAHFLVDYCTRHGLALVLVTHNQEVAHLTPRCLHLSDGRLLTASES